jgi:DNA topoisomerase-1
MPKNLVIVESPAKAKTIAKYLGKEYEVKSSFGHIRDLPKKGLSVDIEHGFKPDYQITPDKKKVVAELKSAAKNAEVWLASDEDREGEAIAWHLTQAMKLDPKTTKRIVFHEITKPAIEHAVANPRTIDLHLVDSYQARRVLDRLVGYEISPVLWRKVRPGLSAGRVQSVAVRLIVEREREIQAFQATSSFKINAIFIIDGVELKAELATKLANIDDARSFLEAARAASFSVAGIDQKPGARNPSAPFTTSTLQQEAARRLGFSVRQTMTLAQRLYENGHITYMRTDSTLLSGLAINAAESYIKTQFGEQYHQRRQYQTKDANAQEAHEAIRPTNFEHTARGDDEQQKRLYQLIWQRALASQMAPAQVEKTDVTIAVSNRPEQLVAKGEVLRFDGFLKVYGGGKDDTILPPLTKGQALRLGTMSALETFSRPPARYSEAALVKKMEELGIGRPSTYASIISTIQTRGYVEKASMEGTQRQLRQLILSDGAITEENTSEITGADTNKLLPTPVADVTIDFLAKYFPNIVDYDFTADTENTLDKIADGKEQWEQMISTFYDGFHPLLTEANEASRKEVSQARLVGNDPKTNQPIYARFGRYGPVLQRGEVESEDKPDFAPLPEGEKIETVTLEQALGMFKLPRVVGTTADGQEMKANIGRFGPYIQVGPSAGSGSKSKTFVSIKPHDPMKITEEEARELYEAKLEKDRNRIIKTFPSGVQLLNGMYGPYISDGKKNARIPKGTEPADITEDQAKDLLAKAPGKRRAFRRRKP